MNSSVFGPILVFARYVLIFGAAVLLILITLFLLYVAFLILCWLAGFVTAALGVRM